MKCARICDLWWWMLSAHQCHCRVCHHCSLDELRFVIPKQIQINNIENTLLYMEEIVIVISIFRHSNTPRSMVS